MAPVALAILYTIFLAIAKRLQPEARHTAGANA
jgi:hypothetical protein